MFLKYGLSKPRCFLSCTDHLWYDGPDIKNGVSCIFQIQTSSTGNLTSQIPNGPSKQYYKNFQKVWSFFQGGTKAKRQNSTEKTPGTYSGTLVSIQAKILKNKIPEHIFVGDVKQGLS